FNLGKFEDCCKDKERAFFGGIKTSEYDKLKTSVCCPENSPDVERKIVYTDSDVFEIPQEGRCCREGERIVLEFNGVRWDNLGDHRNVLGLQVCCPTGTEWSSTSEEESLLSGEPKGSCKKKCCNKENGDSDCSKICFKNLKEGFDAIIPEECTNEGYCRPNFDKRQSIFNSFGLTCENVKSLDHEGNIKSSSCGIIWDAKIVCKSDTACGSRCNGERKGNDNIMRDVIIRRGCNSERSACEDKVEELCSSPDEVCIEHRSSFSSPITTSCEKCPESISFSSDQKFGLREYRDGYKINIGVGGTFTTGATMGLPAMTIEDFFERLSHICNKCKKIGKKIKVVSLNGHGKPEGPLFWDDSINYFERLDKNKLSEMLSSGKYDSIKDCAENFIFASCSVGAGEVAKDFSKWLNPPGQGTSTNVYAATTTSFSGGDNCELRLGNPQQWPITTYPPNTNSGTTIPHTVYYLTQKDALYPGFGKEVYQIKVLNGNLKQIKISLENETPNFLFAEVEDEALSMCEYEVLDEKEVLLNPLSQKVLFNKLSFEILPGSFQNNFDEATISLKKISLDCIGYELQYPKKISPPSQSEISNITSLFNEGIIDKAFYDDFKYRFDNQLECTKNEHCVGLRCTMGNLNCSYSCQEGECVMSGSTGQGIVTLANLVDYISQWINGDVTLAVLKDKITLWITGETEEGSGDTNRDETTRPANNLETGLTAYYTFDNDTTTKVFDVSGKNNDGSITSNAGSVVYVNGKLSKAVSFIESGQISISHSEDFNFGTGEFTMLGWVKISSASNTLPRHIFGKRDTTGGGNWARLFTRDNGKIVFEFTNGDSLPSTFSYADDNWHFIAMSRNTNGEVLFVINNKTFTQTFNQDTTNTGDFTIGKWNTEESFIGEVDEVRIYNKALTQIEILEKYNAER
ncbi:MAG: LamG domain-containing protein, partial [Nanoarchaeota archaeon]